MEKWIYDIAFRDCSFETALDICFAAASCEVENMINSRISKYNYFDNLRGGFIFYDSSPPLKYNDDVVWNNLIKCNLY